MKKTQEKETQKAILKYLSLRGYFHWRNNSGAMKTQSGGFYFFGAVGSPDIFLLNKGILYGLEVKGEKGKQSEGQVAFGNRMVDNGGVYAVVHSLDDVMALGL